MKILFEKEHEMKKRIIIGLLATFMLAATVVGCGNRQEVTGSTPAVIEDTIVETNEIPTEGGETETVNSDEESWPALSLQFGYDGPVYTATLEQNDTAAMLIRYTRQGEYNLPIYTYENYENEDVLQFYDIPSRYDIPSETVHVTEEKAGELYYSSPNRVILFYQDANVEGDFTKIGQIDDIEGLVDAVRNNKPLVDWDCLVIPVRVIE